MSFRVLLATPQLAPHLAPLTRKEFRPLLEGAEPGGVALALLQRVASGESPVGLALARCDAAGQGSAELLSIFIQSPLWRRGLGRQLLALLEEHLARHHGVREMRVFYTTQAPQLTAFEALLRRQQWSPPVVSMELIQFVHRSRRRSPALVEFRLPPGMTVFPWLELSAAQRAQLEAHQAEVPPEFWPFVPETVPLDPIASLGLATAEGEVVGWMLTHRVAPDTVRYTTMYVRAPWRTAALSFRLAAEAFRRAERAYGEELKGAYAVVSQNAPMLRVLQRKYAASAIANDEVRRAVKQLRPPQ